MDQIVREAYAIIYDGNVRNQEHHKAKYLEPYKQFIYSAQAATMEEMTGKGLKITMSDAKEIAAGLGQRSLGDLKMVSDQAYEVLARLFNHRKRSGAAHIDEDCKGIISIER